MPSSRRNAPKPPPNYAARRMLASTVAITLLVIGGVLLYRLLAGDSGLLDTDDLGWNRVMVIDTADGDANSVPVDGDPQPIALTSGSEIEAVFADDGRLAYTTRRELRTANSDGATTLATVPDGYQVTRLAVDGLVFAIGDPAGGNILIVDAIENRQIDVGALIGNNSPRLFVDSLRYDSAGQRFAIADTVSFQTIVVSFDDDEPLYLPDAPVAVGADGISTIQIVGDRADVALYDIDGTELATASTEVIVAGAIDRHRLTAVTTSGQIVRLERNDTETQSIDGIGRALAEQDVELHRLTAVDRYLLSTDDGMTLLDTDGTVIADRPDVTLLDAPMPSARCVAVRDPDGSMGLVNADSGERTATFEEYETSDSGRNGCQLIAERGGRIDYVRADPGSDAAPLTAPIDDAERVWLSPDGESIVATDEDGRTTLRTFDDGELIVVRSLSDSTPDQPAVVFVKN